MWKCVCQKITEQGQKIKKCHIYDKINEKTKNKNKSQKKLKYGTCKNVTTILEMYKKIPKF